MYNNVFFECFISDSTFAQRFCKVADFCYIFFGPTLGVFVPFIEYIYIYFLLNLFRFLLFTLL